MTFTITALTAQSQWRNFLLAHEDVEQVYEFLRAIVGQGDTLVTVIMNDRNGYLPLPLDSLEEDTFLNPIRELRRQWEPLLTKPKGQEFTQRLAELQLANIARVRQTIIRLHDLTERTQDQLKANSKQTVLLEHYNRLLDDYSRLLVKLETDRS